MKQILKKTLLVLILPTSSIVATNSLDFSSLVEEFMNQSGVLKKTINLSGKQRMLTQYMSKLVLQIELNVQKKESMEKLEELASLYDTTLKAFKNGDSKMGIPKASNKDVLIQITKVENLWKDFYVHIQTISKNKDNGESFKYIMSNNEKLLALSNELVKAYELSNTSENYLEVSRLSVVNVAGRQRMLTQKMTKEKLLILRGDKRVREKLLKTVKLFDDSLNALIQGDESQKITKATNKKITKQLQVVLKMWNTLEPLYIKEKTSAKEMAIILSKNTKLLKEMNSMVQLSEVEVEY
ncbi:MAG: Nitric oxide -responding transcriptional regulator Dnr (Crp/Fnr family) [uncultured Sulfurovum sp.]|uniref:Nitric oxide -responding transcriptional regulator Dnr (Crp/Fnr family) n=1 Tax=uncultured Sulfurovum sp. TaxID=269237 RepID=A0A6S6SGS0_9BACT|nr:MAG: Nitric oxide -responding transcriptional regulator Dnr (Crp/Fnr family) [uncultured Sulfurovum sp.]